MGAGLLRNTWTALATASCNESASTFTECSMNWMSDKRRAQRPRGACISFAFRPPPELLPRMRRSFRNCFQIPCQPIKRFLIRVVILPVAKVSDEILAIYRVLRHAILTAHFFRTPPSTCFSASIICASVCFPLLIRFSLFFVSNRTSIRTV